MSLSTVEMHFTLQNQAFRLRVLDRYVILTRVLQHKNKVHKQSLAKQHFGAALALK